MSLVPERLSNNVWEWADNIPYDDLDDGPKKAIRDVERTRGERADVKRHSEMSGRCARENMTRRP